MSRQNSTSLALFNGLSARQSQQISPLLEPCRFTAGEAIFAQGQRAEYLFLLLAGEVRVDYKPYDGPPLTVARIQPGEVFGWSAALLREKYTSGAVAVSEGQAYRLRGALLRRLCELDPETGSLLLERLTEGLAERLRNTYAEILGILGSGIEHTAGYPTGRLP